MNGPKQIWTADMVEARNAKRESEQWWEAYQKQALLERTEQEQQNLERQIQFKVNNNPKRRPWRFILILALLAIVGYFVTNSLLK